MTNGVGTHRSIQLLLESLKPAVDCILRPGSSLGVSKQWAIFVLRHQAAADFDSFVWHEDYSLVFLAFCFTRGKDRHGIVEVNMMNLECSCLYWSASGRPHEIQKVAKLLVFDFAANLFPLNRSEHGLTSGFLRFVFDVRDRGSCDVSTLNRPIASSLDSGDGVIACGGRPVLSVFDPLRAVDAIELGHGKSRAESSSEKRQIVFGLLVRSFGSIFVEPFKVRIEKMRYGVEGGLRTATAAHELVVLLKRSSLVFTKVDLLLANLDVPGAGEFPEKRLRLSHCLSLPSET